MDDPTRDPSAGADLGTRLRTIAAWGDPGEVPDPADLRASTLDRFPLSARRWVPLTAAAAVALVVGVFGVIAVTAPQDDEIHVAGGPDFASAIEASGVLASPSADDVERARDRDLYKPHTGPTQVSAAGNFVSLRTCRFWQVPEPSPACPAGFPAGWAYAAGPADGVEVHRGLLGDASDLALLLLDDRYFVALDTAPDAQAPSVAWLIDAESGKVGPLRWRNTPTTLRSPAQALLVCEEELSWCSLPKVVDARDGTIQPLAVPDDAAPSLPVTQHGTDRIWVGTGPDGDQLGLAYSDDGGETWTDVALPEQMAATSEELPSDLAHEDKLLEIAVDGDRVAVAFSWRSRERDTARDKLYLSDDAGRTWTSRHLPAAAGNGAHLYVLADRRLVLMWSVDAYPTQVLVSTASDWAALEEAGVPEVTWPGEIAHERDFTVNRAGIAFSSLKVNTCDVVGATCTFASAEAELDVELDVTIKFSTDLTNWWTIEALDD